LSNLYFLLALNGEVKRRDPVQWRFVAPDEWANVTILDAGGQAESSEIRGPCLVFVVMD